MENKNNRNGNGIFLGVVSVATLIVAIIGATFAYFSASTESDENAVNLGAYEYKLSLSMSQVYPENASAASGIIPLVANKTIDNAEAPNNTNLLYALNVASKKCVDDNGLTVCALYKVEILNDGSNPVTLNGQIQTTSNEAADGDDRTPFENLTYQALNGEEGEFTLDGSPVTISGNVGEFTDIQSLEVTGAVLSDTDGSVTTQGKGVAYVLIYLNDKDTDQSKEMGATFEGKVIYKSGTGAGQGLTGTFKVGGESPSEPSSSNE